MDALRGFRRGPVTAALIVALLVTGCGGASQPEAGAVRHPCDYVSTGDLNAIADGKWSSSRTKQGTFETCQFDDPGDMGHLIPPSFAVVSISTSYPSWDAIAKGADSTPVAGLGDEAYLTGSGIVLFVRKGTVVFSTTVADMIVENLDQGDFNVDPAQDRAKAEAIARLVLGKLP